MDMDAIRGSLRFFIAVVGGTAVTGAVIGSLATGAVKGALITPEGLNRWAKGVSPEEWQKLVRVCNRPKAITSHTLLFNTAPPHLAMRKPSRRVHPPHPPTHATPTLSITLTFRFIPQAFCIAMDVIGAAPEILLPGPAGHALDVVWAPMYAFILFQTFGARSLLYKVSGLPPPCPASFLHGREWSSESFIQPLSKPPRFECRAEHPRCLGLHRGGAALHGLHPVGHDRLAPRGLSRPSGKKPPERHRRCGGVNVEEWGQEVKGLLEGSFGGQGSMLDEQWGRLRPSTTRWCA